MEKQSPFLPEQVSPEEWELIPDNVKLLINSLIARLVLQTPDATTLLQLLKSLSPSIKTSDRSNSELNLAKPSEQQSASHQIWASQEVQEALRQSETRFRNMAANVPGAIFRYLLRPDGSDAVIYMSNGCNEIFEFPAEAVVSDASLLWQMIHPDDQERIYASVMVSARTLEPWSFQWRCITKSGKLKWLESAGRPEQQPNGDIIWDTLILDISDRHDAEEKLRYANETNQALIDAIPDLIIHVNRDGFYLGGIGSDEIEFAVFPEDLVGKKISDVLEPQLAQERMYFVEKAFATGEVQFHEYRINIRGKWRCEEARIVVSGKNEAIMLIRDITDRKTAELALQESETRYRLLSENTNDLVCLHDPDGRYNYVSPSCETLLGYRYDEMIGCDPYALLHPDDCDRLRQDTHAQALLGKSVPSTYRIRQKSGNYIWFETLTKPIMDKNGTIIQLQTTSRDVTERIQAQAKLEYDSFHDALTGLPNRHLLSERLELAIHRIHRHDNYKFAVLFLDLDRFKIVNDSLGHVVGDRLLVAIAQQLQLTFRDIDLIARIGGDEFVVLLEDIQDIQEAVQTTERLLSSLQIPVTIGDRQVYTSCSVGIVFGSPSYHQSSELLRDADIAMYRAKSQGKARYEIFDSEMHRQALVRMHLENNLRQAIELQGFSLQYQPLVCLNTGKLLGFEALIRWYLPTQGWKSPNEFIPVAEELGIIHQLSYWVLREACQQLVTWHRAFPEFSDLKVNINLSSQDLQHPDLIQQIDQVLAQTKLSPHLLTVEITERMVIENVEATIAILTKLRERGIEISIDDFGTGYSSLSYLHLLPINSLKVDHSFVNQMTESNKNYRIVETIATLSKQLELDAIAEGIETLPQLKKLQELGYRFGQGYLFSNPLNPEAIETLLKDTDLCLSTYGLLGSDPNQENL
ncbi:EAL domain-containing protein [Pseudanabaena biceps]|nr:EAL domain-containing protein [Pseudanabaena biceps]